MGTHCYRIKKLLGVALLSLLLINGLPGTVIAVNPGKVPSQEPEIFRQLGATASGLRFFSSPTDNPVPFKERTYKRYFSQAEARYICYELNLGLKAKRNAPVRLKIQATLYGHGEGDRKETHLFTIQPGVQKMFLTGGWKSDTSGGGWWFPGSYRVVLRVDNQEIASGSFEVGMY